MIYINQFFSNVSKNLRKLYLNSNIYDRKISKKITNNFNYKPSVIIKNFFNNKVNNRFLLNISSKYEKFFKNRENIKNLFPIQKNI